MSKDPMTIGIVAPGGRIEKALAEQVGNLARTLYPRLELRFHPQCFLSHGHFAGDDDTRAQAFLDVANDEGIDAVWFARGGYGACRIAPHVVAQLRDVARRKIYLGYSDAGMLLAGLYRAGFPRLAHGPMPSDMNRDGGEAAVTRALAFLTEKAPSTLEPHLAARPAIAFNITVLCHLLGTPLEPDLTDHVLMLEEVNEPLYR
ncbi:MAG TPA: LD-carboxypeptidase, partial [Stellaceae bacterium]|nr:LD-carboxypeptidase [Stellaceae bacterium]